ncbi:hypothetical protein RHGRI_000182 [Rhododendron griersonianum]|uniref:Uncharacterized protein n=1 Tax=Rhododendron griersonianum TaxID=479676 RepID=A0AAV6LHY5_9ERIC|nr:hypothetical protein RHGRI_000182 [Rhododendron griersonianum]
MKAMAEHLPKENSHARPISQGSKETDVPEAIEEKLPLVSDEEKKCPVSAEEETKVEGAACVDRSPSEELKCPAIEDRVEEVKGVVVKGKFEFFSAWLSTVMK